MQLSFNKMPKTTRRPAIRNLSLFLLVLLYLGAGINHFWHPLFYERIIPPYLPFHALINKLSGVAEFVLGLLLIFPRSRTFAAYAIIGMLIIFITAHIYLIQISGCSNAGFCGPLFVAWVRLVPGQLLLIWWAWWHRY